MSGEANDTFAFENLLDNSAEQLDELRQRPRRGGHSPTNRAAGL